jgi:hypothetical protein
MGETYRYAVKEIVVIVLVLLKYANILEDLQVNRNLIIVSNGVFAQEVKHDEVR